MGVFRMLSIVNDLTPLRSDDVGVARLFRNNAEPVGVVVKLLGVVRVPGVVAREFCVAMEAPNWLMTDAGSCLSAPFVRKRGGVTFSTSLSQLCD